MKVQCVLRLQKGSEMTDNQEQSDENIPGGLLGPLPGKDFRIGHIDVEDSEQTAGTATTDGK